MDINPKAKEARLQYQRDHYHRNAETYKARSHQRYHAKAADERARMCRNDKLKQRYGITLDQYERALQRQGGGCAICDKAPEPRRALAVDHCHRTGAFRGLLCQPCNTALGGFCDSSVVMRRALLYLAQGGA